MAGLKSRLSSRPNAWQLARIVRMRHPFKGLIRTCREELHRNQYPRGYLAHFLIGSVAAGEATLIELKVRIAPADAQIPEERLLFETTIIFDGPMSELSRPKPHTVGRADRIKRALSGSGHAHKSMLIRTCGRFQRFCDGQDLRLNELRNIILCLLRMEAHSGASREYVGLPFRVATLEPGKPILVRECAS